MTFILILSADAVNLKLQKYFIKSRKTAYIMRISPGAQRPIAKPAYLLYREHVSPYPQRRKEQMKDFLVNILLSSICTFILGKYYEWVDKRYTETKQPLDKLVVIILSVMCAFLVVALCQVFYVSYKILCA